MTFHIFSATLLGMTIKRISKECLQCGKAFLAAQKEVNRGNAKFCSRSCGTTHFNIQNNANPAEKVCKFCGGTYVSGANVSLFCSSRCKDRNTAKKRYGVKSTKSKYAKQLPCELCGWEVAPRDIHHIVPIREGGTNDAGNLITLCPNCHRCADRNLISRETLLKVVTNRTISSSEVLTSELDANVVIKET